MIQKVVVQAYQNYDINKIVVFEIGGVLASGKIQEFEKVRTGGTLGYRIRFNNATIAFFPEISGSIGTSGTDGETMDELKQGIEKFLAAAPQRPAQLSFTDDETERDPTKWASIRCAI